MIIRSLYIAVALVCLSHAPMQASGSRLVEGAAQAPPGHSAQQPIQRLVSAPLPGHTSAVGQPSLYKPDNLYEYIDGGADVYLLYDFQQLLHQQLKDGGAELTADIYEMRTPEDAFGIYAAERSPSYQFIMLGVDGYR